MCVSFRSLEYLVNDGVERMMIGRVWRTVWQLNRSQSHCVTHWLWEDCYFSFIYEDESSQKDGKTILWTASQKMQMVSTIIYLEVTFFSARGWQDSSASQEKGPATASPSSPQYLDSTKTEWWSMQQNTDWYCQSSELRMIAQSQFATPTTISWATTTTPSPAPSLDIFVKIGFLRNDTNACRRGEGGGGRLKNNPIITVHNVKIRASQFVGNSQLCH